MKYGIVFEAAADGGVGAYLPDMPGLGVVGTDRADAVDLLHRAIQMHVRGLVEDGDGVPPPSTNGVNAADWYVDVEHSSSANTTAQIVKPLRG